MLEKNDVLANIFFKKSQLAIDFEFIQVYVHVMKVLFE